MNTLSNLPPPGITDQMIEDAQGELHGEAEGLAPIPQMDWGQVAANGGPPCFFVEGPQFCGCAERWQGHGNSAFHDYVSLEQYIATRATVPAEEAAEICAEMAREMGTKELQWIGKGEPEAARVCGGAAKMLREAERRIRAAPESSATGESK